MGTSTKNITKISWLYFTATSTLMMSTMIQSAFLVYYLTERMLLSTIVMSALMLASRFVNLVEGMLAGIVVQKFRPRAGRYRFWFIWGPVALMAGNALCFMNPAIPTAAKTVMVFIGMFLFGGGMSLVQVSQSGMLATIAGPDMNVRMRLSGKTIQGQSAGSIITSLVMVPFIMFLEARGTDGYTVVQFLFAAAGIIGMICLYFGTKEYENYAGEAGTPEASAGNRAAPGIGSMFMDALKNRQLVILFCADALRQATFIFMMGLAAYYFNLAAKNPGMMTLFLSVQSVLGLILAFAVAPLARKLGKKNSALLTGCVSTTAYLLLALFARDNLILFMVFAIAAYAGQVVINSCGVNLYLDCGEYQLYQSGRDNRAFVMSIFGIAMNTALMLAPVFIGIVLSGGGYDGSAIANPRRMTLLIGLIPAGLNLLYTLLMAAYGITEAKAKEYAEANFRLAAAQTVSLGSAL